jgi:hypothetical protein
MNIEEQKEVANWILNRMEILDPTCIIAGGAPRDWYLGKECNDIDLYFYYRFSNEPEIFTSNALSKIGLENIVHIGRENTEFPENYKRNPFLKRVYEIEQNGLKVQLIQMIEKTFKHVVDDFPLNICQIWYKKGKIFTTNNFEKAIEFKTLILLNDLYSDGDRYIEKIKNKFSDYAFYKSELEFLRTKVYGTK